MTGVDELVKIFQEKLTRTGSFDQAFTKTCWVAYKQGYADGSTNPNLHTVVGWVLDEGHLHTELLARLRAAWEEEQGPRTEDPAIHYCHRFAILMECVMLGGVDKYWDEAHALLDGYNAARDKWMEAQGQPYVSGFGKD